MEQHFEGNIVAFVEVEVPIDVESPSQDDVDSCDRLLTDDEKVDWESDRTDVESVVDTEAVLEGIAEETEFDGDAVGVTIAAART